MSEQIFNELSELFLLNIDIMRQTIKIYKKDKQKLISVLEKELKQQKYKYGKSWDADIKGDLLFFDISSRGKQTITWRIDLSAEKMAAMKAVVVSREKVGRKWEEKQLKEVSIKNKLPEVIVGEIIKLLEE